MSIELTNQIIMDWKNKGNFVERYDVIIKEFSEESVLLDFGDTKIGRDLSSEVSDYNLANFFVYDRDNGVLHSDLPLQIQSKNNDEITLPFNVEGALLPVDLTIQDVDEGGTLTVYFVHPLFDINSNSIEGFHPFLMDRDFFAGYWETESSFYIPSEVFLVNGSSYTIHSISNLMFPAASQFESIVISDSIETVSSGAFIGARTYELYIPNTMQVIEEGAFDELLPIDDTITVYGDLLEGDYRYPSLYMRGYTFPQEFVFHEPPVRTTKTESKEEKIPVTITYKTDASQYTDYTDTVLGTEGVETTTWDEVLYDGINSGVRENIKTAITTPMVPTVVTTGTKPIETWKVVTKYEKIPLTKETIEDPELEIGQTRYEEGTEGQLKITLEEQYIKEVKSGVTRNRTEEIITQMIPTKEFIGTKVVESSDGFIGFYYIGKVVEMNQSTGLRNGHIVDQTKLFLKNTREKYFDNGFILALDTTKNELKLSDGTESDLFIHFTEEYYAIPEIYKKLDKFSLKVKEFCLPRAVALYTGDTWTTNNFEGEFTSNQLHWATVNNGKLTITSEQPTQGHYFLAFAATLPDGETPSATFIFVRG